MRVRPLPCFSLIALGWLLAAVVGACLPQAAAAQSGLSTSESVLRPGDMVRVTVWRKPDLSGEFSISGDSSVAFPPYAGVKVAGVSMAVATARLKEALRRFEVEPMLLLEPLVRVAVGGEVRQPNLFSLSPSTTIAQAVAMAGGATERGHLDRVRVLRDGRSTVIDLLNPDPSTAQLTVRSGDQILVERRSNGLRDVIGPVASILAATAAIVNVFLYNR